VHASDPVGLLVITGFILPAAFFNLLGGTKTGVYEAFEE
jgi:hypothetical protein